jgi:hypothetical protein
MDSKAVNRNALTVERGTSRRVFGAKHQATRDAHTLVVQTIANVATTVPEPHQYWAADLRRGRLSIYGGLLRFLELLHRQGVTKEVALMIPKWITAFIEEEWGTPATAALKLDRAA